MDWDNYILTDEQLKVIDNDIEELERGLLYRKDQKIRHIVGKLSLDILDIFGEINLGSDVVVDVKGDKYVLCSLNEMISLNIKDGTYRHPALYGRRVKADDKLTKRTYCLYRNSYLRKTGESYAKF